MKKNGWFFVIGAACCALLALSVWHFLQEKHVDAHWRAVRDDMDKIRMGVIQNWQVSGAFPESIRKLAPDFVSADVLDRPARYDLTHRSIVVPAAPYDIRRTTNGFEVSCVFHWAGYHRVVMDHSGDERAE